MRVPIAVVWLVAGSLAIAGCNMPVSTPSEGSSPGDAGGQAVSPSVASTPFIRSSATPVPTLAPSPEATPVQAIACPVTPGGPALPQLQVPASYGADLLAFLNGGGDVHALENHIQALKLSPQTGIHLAQQDFNGDGLDDVAVSLLAPDNAAIVAPGDLYVFLCGGQIYALNYTSPQVSDIGAPEILDARDLNADGAADLLTARESCGVHTCFSQLEVLTWHQNTMMNVMLGESDDLPYPSIRVVGPSGDGRYGLAVTGTAIGSAGAGPYRGLTRTWVWDPTGLSLVPGPDLALPSTFRIHVLNDADQADLAGDYTTALELYARVVNDDSLQDWVDPARERANLGAYAMFRQVLAQLQLADSTAAQAAYLALQDANPPASPGGAYGLLGQAFWTAYQASGSIGLACAQAQAFAQANQPTILQALDFGYANPTYSATDICPAAGP